MSRLWVQAFTTGAILLIAFVLFDRSVLGWKDLVRGMLPITGGTWWFATAFFVLIALAPALDHFIRSSGQKMQTCTVALMLVFWGFAQYLPGQSFSFSEVILFVELYLVGAYVRQFIPVGRAGRWGWFTVSALTLMALSAVGIQLASGRWAVAAAHLGIFVSDSSPLTIVAAVAALCTVRALPTRTNLLVNWAASMMFGVYLFHEYPPVRSWLWPNVPGIEDVLSNPWFPLHTLVTTLAVFFAATALEIVRHYLVQRPIMRALEPVLARADAALPALAQKALSASQRAASWIAQGSTKH